MARGGAARHSARGGDPVQALRQARPRLILGAAAVAGAGGLAANAALAADRLSPLLAILGGCGTVVLAAALVLRRPALVTPALVLLGAAYAALFLVRSGTDVRAPLEGAGFLVVAELAFGALELRAGTPEPGLIARRTALTAAAAVGGVALGTLALAAAAVPVGGGIALEAVGVCAAVALLALLARMAGRAA